MVKCSNCNYEAGERYFCPNCGTKIIKDNLHTQKDNNEQAIQKINNKSEYNSNEDNDIIDNIMDFDDKISNKVNGLLFKNKAMDKVLDKSSSMNYKKMRESVNNEKTRKYYKKIEPVFLEVLDSIEDEFVKSILLYERSIMVSGNVVNIVAAHVYTPTKDMSHDDAVNFYIEMANNIVAEIIEEKQKGIFDEEEFYKRKVKNATIESASVLGISKSLKTFRRNRNKRI